MTLLLLLQVISLAAIEPNRLCARSTPIARGAS